MPKRKARPELRVVFDTSVLYTQVSSDLVRESVRALVQDNSAHADLLIHWYLPRVVVNERRYQMRAKARELLPNTQKLERLLGHNLNITEDILDLRVDEAIERGLADLKLQVLELDQAQVSWSDIIRRSTSREPPFEPGEKEKGFRDSLIAESFFQLLERSPNTPSRCRLAIVTDDDRLSEYVLEKTSENKNVRVLSSLEELESLINTLVSAATEEFVADVAPRASSYFFEKGNRETLYYREELGNVLRETFAEELKSLPAGATHRKNGQWWIMSPVFIRKEKQRMYWATGVRVDATAYRYAASSESQLARPTPSALEQLASLDRRALDQSLREALGNTAASGHGQEARGLIRRAMANEPNEIAPNALRGLLGPAPERITVASGSTGFEVNWSINITQAKKLTSARIEGVECLGTYWGED